MKDDNRVIIVKDIGVVKTFPETIKGASDLLKFMRENEDKKLCVVLPPNSRFETVMPSRWFDEYIPIQSLNQRESNNERK